MKGDFIKALHRIAFVIKPGALIIEASGVANPTDLGRIIFSPLYEGRYMHMENVCIIDAANFPEQYEIFTAIEKQIEVTRTFIINKTDLVEPGTVDSVKHMIRGQSPQATFAETSSTKVKTCVDFRTGRTVASHAVSLIRVRHGIVGKDVSRAQ